MKKLLASDLDGTLIFNNRISEENKEALHKLKDKGNLFAISTGRPLNGVEKIIDTLNLKPDYLILNNGALILDKVKNIVHKEYIKYDLVKEIVEKAIKTNVMVAVETGFKTYPIGINSRLVKDKLFENIGDSFDNVECIDSVCDIEEKETLTLISIYYPEYKIQEVQKVCDDINRKYGNEIVAYRNSTFIDVVAKGCSKGNGVISVSKMSGIDIDNVYTIGDSWNDDSMFEITKNSFTFTYAEELLKEKTSNIVQTVAECINTYIIK